jgi:hypothetical protein
MNSYQMVLHRPVETTGVFTKFGLLIDGDAGTWPEPVYSTTGSGRYRAISRSCCVMFAMAQGRKQCRRMMGGREQDWTERV